MAYWHYYRAPDGREVFAEELLRLSPEHRGRVIDVIDRHRTDCLLTAEACTVGDRLHALVTTPPGRRFGVLYAVLDDDREAVVGLCAFRASLGRVPQSARQPALKDPDVDAARRDAYIRANLIRMLAQMRTKLGMTQRDVALAMKTTQSAVSDLENGFTDPRLSTLQRYARAVQSEIEFDLVQPRP
ncbi:MAG TPA: helix-turn-helix transcriptional regulator [Micromonosporaceae bacterium]|nr:helix-turn-helix transcriptional regulator [Micromonosporaceae bacterium]